MNLEEPLEDTQGRQLSGTKLQVEDRAYAKPWGQGTVGPFEELCGVAGA